MIKNRKIEKDNTKLMYSNYVMYNVVSLGSMLSMLCQVKNMTTVQIHNSTAMHCAKNYKT